MSRTCGFFLERKDAPWNIGKIPARLPPQHLKPNIGMLLRKAIGLKAQQIKCHLARCLASGQKIHVEHGKAAHHHKRAEQAQHDHDFSSVQQRVHRMLQRFADKRQRHHEHGRLDAEIHDEAGVIPLADTGADPKAVVVKGTHAALAGMAVVRSKWCVMSACSAARRMFRFAVQWSVELLRTIMGGARFHRDDWIERQEINGAVLRIFDKLDTARVAEAQKRVPSIKQSHQMIRLEADTKCA